MKRIGMLVLLSGPVAVGKTTLRQVLLEEHDFDYVRSSTYLIELATKQAIAINRSNLQELGDALDARTDYRWVLDSVAVPAMAQHSQTRRWLVDAVRKARQVEHFRAEFGAAVFHVHLTASESVLRQRYERRAAAIGADGDTTPYGVAVGHANELAARGLAVLADLVIDVESMPARDVAATVVAAFGSRQRGG